jgi:hypothetical protein
MKYDIDITMFYMLLMHIYRRLWIVIYRDDDDDVWSSRLYYNLMRRSIFMTIHMNVLCDDGHIMTHVNENDNAGDMLFLWFVYYYYHNYCDGVWMWITIMRM